MIWQDALIGAGQLFLSLALIPALCGSEKPPHTTCGITTLVLFANACALVTLGLWWGALTTFACAACWLVLLMQRRVAWPPS